MMRAQGLHHDHNGRDEGRKVATTQSRVGKTLRCKGKHRDSREDIEVHKTVP